MLFEFSPDPAFNFVTGFAHHLSVETDGQMLRIPHWLGKGTIRIVDLAPDFQLALHHYQLNEELILQRIAPVVPTDVVRILFNIHLISELSPSGNDLEKQGDQEEKAIRITSDNLSSQMCFPAHSEIYFTVVGVRLDRLKELLAIKSSNTVVQTILTGTSSYLFYEPMSLRMQDILKQLTQASVEEELFTLFYKIKVQELIYLLFTQLLKRNTIHHYPINKADIDKLFLIRSEIVADLAKPPRLESLSRLVGLSETKITDLFK